MLRLSQFIQSRFLLTLLFGSIYCPNAFSEPITLSVSEGEPNSVTFTSIAPLETIIGRTSAISGTIVFDPDDLGAPAEAVLVVKMETLDTGNKIRDGHMRKNHLHTDEFPISRFTLKALLPSSFRGLESGKSVRFKARGSFLCHGKINEIEPEIIALWDRKKQELQIEALFSVQLSRYDIPRPQFLVLKLEDTQIINVKFTAR